MIDMCDGRLDKAQTPLPDFSLLVVIANIDKIDCVCVCMVVCLFVFVPFGTTNVLSPHRQ